MANHRAVTFNAGTVRLEIPQAGDGYLFEQPITITGTFNGRSTAQLTADWNKLDFVTVTGAVDLDTINARVAALDASVVLMGGWDASTLLFPASTKAGESWHCTVAGTVDGVDFSVGDRVVALVDAAPNGTYAGNWLKLDYTDQVLSVGGKTGAVTLVEADISDLQAYLLPTDLDTPAKLNALIGESVVLVEDINTAAELNAIVSDTDVLLANGTVQTIYQDFIPGAPPVNTRGRVYYDSAKERLCYRGNGETHTIRSELDPVQAGLTAFAGGGQASATQLNYFVNEVATVASVGDSVKLPTAVAGAKVVLVNNGAFAMDVFPALDDAIDGNATNTAISVPSGEKRIFTAYDAVNWVTI